METTIQLLLGVLLAFGLVLLARLREKERQVYGIVLIITAAYYVAASLLRGQPEALPLEFFGLVIFGAAGIMGMRDCQMSGSRRSARNCTFPRRRADTGQRSKMATR